MGSNGRRDEPVTGGRVPAAAAPALLTITPSYVDRFTLNTDVQATPNRWARAMFEEGIPRRDRNLIFHTILRLGIGPDGDPGSVSGWRIVSEDAAHILVSASSPGSTAQLLTEVSDGSVTLTTAFVFTSDWRARVWSVVAVAHRRLAAPTMRRGADLIRQSA